jgi:beta-lactamase regulating signal transducer with metallopeptidase domain
MILYLLKSAGCLALLLLFYHLVLEKEKIHNFNRYYLLISVLFSFLAPLVAFTTYIKKTIVASTKIVESPFIRDLNSMNIQENSFDYSQLIIGIYLIISSVFLIRFGLNLFEITRKTNKNEKVKYLSAVLVLVDDEILPHSFWNYIFINKEEYTNGNIEEELFTHELTHVTQKHTFDILLIELLQAVFWINPLFIFLKKAIQLNHEFLADENVIIKHKNTFHYQYLLLNKASWNNEYYLASNLNYSLTKKRLKMMTTQSSRTTILLKKLAVLPLLTGFIFLFAERIEAQEKEEIIEIVEEQPEKVYLSEKEIYKEYYYKNLVIRKKDKNGKHISKKYSKLNEEEKARLIPPPPLKLKKVIPTKAQFEALKDKTKYAVWVDGKVVDNKILNNYKHTDFARYFNSLVYKNARSKHFPQENQASLQTLNYFEDQNKKRVENFKKYSENTIIVEEVLENPNKVYIDSPVKPAEEQSLKTGDIRLKLKDVNVLKKNYKKDSIIFFISKNNSLKKYKELNVLYTAHRNKKPHFVKSSKEIQENLSAKFSELGSLYFKLSKADKRKRKDQFIQMIDI